MQAFVVRIWSASAGDASEQIRGVVEHLGSGESQPFKDHGELLAFLSRRAASVGTGGSAARGRGVEARSSPPRAG